MDEFFSKISIIFEELLFYKHPNKSSL